ncbi:MAG: pilus (MSHA type) biogenesis protein MshL [Methylotenera sp.]|nr:pilus (MSHA type) biogenesis protein MshL [Methylotenera sp.]
MLVLGMSACAHQSKIQPSKGHIDGQNTGMSQSTAQLATDNASKSPAASSNIPKPVVNNTYLPPPKPQAKAQLYSIVVYDTPVKEVLFAIARDSKLNVDIHPSIQGRVTLNAVDQTLPAILERLSKQVDLTYKIQGNVLIITPDQPVLRTYRVDYVNMSRDTAGFIGAAAEISSTGQGALDAAGSAGGSNNSSRTSVTSESKSHFWETLEKNIKDILAETDKEVIVARTNSLSATNQKSANNTQSAKKIDADVTSATSLAKEKEDAKNEYKTLFAGTVIVNREAGVINVRATNKQHEKVQEFLDKVMSSVRRQVLIEATIVEVRLNDSYQAGIDWARIAGAKGGLSFGQQLGSQVTVNAATGITTSANAFGDKPAAGFVAAYVNQTSMFGNIAASINLLEQFGKTAVLSSPKLMVLNNQTAVLKVVNNLVYFTVKSQQSAQAGGANGGIISTNVETTAHTVPVGVVMTVTPQINSTGNVNINVRPTVSRVVSFKKDPSPNLTVESLIPEIQVREMESMLQIASGNTAVLGGLMQDEMLNNTDKVPGVSKVPVVGKVFTGKNDASRKTELVIFLRPTVISNASLESDELSNYRQYLPSQAIERALEAENER